LAVRLSLHYIKTPDNPAVPKEVGIVRRVKGSYVNTTSPPAPLLASGTEKCKRSELSNYLPNRMHPENEVNEMFRSIEY
jgi:hypothetical protein